MQDFPHYKYRPRRRKKDKSSKKESKRHPESCSLLSKPEKISTNSEEHVRYPSVEENLSATTEYESNINFAAIQNNYQANHLYGMVCIKYELKVNLNLKIIVADSCDGQDNSGAYSNYFESYSSQPYYYYYSEYN